MTHVIRVLVAAGICSMLGVPAVVAAPLRLSLTIRPAGGAGNGRGWTMFTEDGAIGLDVSFVVGEESEAIALRPNFFRNVSIQLVSKTTGAVAGAVRGWPSAVRCAVRQTCPVDGPIELEPTHMATAAVVLTSVDGRPFPEGEYELRVGLESVRGMATAVNSPGSTASLPPSLSYPISIKHPRTETDRLNRLLSLANNALAHDEFEKALSFYRQAASPNHPTVIGGTTQALIGLKRFPEAASLLERFLASEAPQLAPVAAQTLAMIYFANGEDRKAQDILRKHLPPEHLSEASGRLKAAGARARNRPPSPLSK